MMRICSKHRNAIAGETYPRSMRISFLVAVALVGCGDASVGQMSRHEIEHDGLKREYFVYLPKDYERGAAYPVFFFLHGYGGSATGTEAETTNGLNRYAEEYGYIMVYPQGTWFWANESSPARWEASSWNHLSGNRDEGPEGPTCTRDTPYPHCPPECDDCGRCGWTSCHDDIGFLEKMFESVSRDFKTDRSRYYLSGFSNGSMMANRMACVAPGWFAAVALVGGRLERGYQCGPTKALPLLQINGARDETVPFDGRISNTGYFFATSKAVAAKWSESTGCRDESESWSSPISEAAGLRCSATCAGGDRESIDCLWPEGDHHWPGYPQGHGTNGYCVSDMQRQTMPEQPPCVEPDTYVDVWGSRLIFDFFETHRQQ